MTGDQYKTNWLVRRPLKKKLVVLQNNCLRLCTGALKSTPVSVLQITNKEQPLELRKLELQVKFLYKILKDNIFIQNTTDCWKNHYGNQNTNKQALMKRIANIIPIEQLETFYDDYKIQTKVFPIPIWHIPDIQVNLELVNKIDKISNPTRAKLISMECINQYIEEIHIYTDGSKQADNSIASAVYIPKFNIKISKRIQNNCSVFSAELTAIYLALSWIKDLKPYRAVIFSDSLSAIQSLQNIRQQINNSSIIKEIALIITELHYNLNIVTFTWIPSHIDIKGNDKVDNLAKSTCKINQIQLPISLNKNEINTQLQKNFYK